MIKKLSILLLTILLTACLAPKKCCSQEIDIEKLLKFSTFYAAVNGGTSLSDVKVFSVNNGLSTQTMKIKRKLFTMVQSLIIVTRLP